MSDETEPEPDGDSVSESDALSRDGTRYRTLEANKSGERSDDDS